MFQKKKFGMPADGYRLVAAIIRKLPDDLKKPVADHFATEFNMRSASFDAYQWGQATGGKPAPDSAWKRRTALVKRGVGTGVRS
jgi:hypothetical protein